MLISGNAIRNMPLRHSCYRNIGKFVNKPILYGDDAAPPVRFVRMTASILGVHISYCKINLFENENKTDFYTKINPLQKVPALETGGGVISDSHAIAMYLCQNYGDQGLYPDDPLTRARINQMLLYNASVLFPIDSAIFTNFFAGRWDLNDEKHRQWTNALDYLEYNLSNRKWLAGDQMRLCDICAVCTVTSMHELVPLTSRHKNVVQWIKRLEALDCYEINKIGLQRLKHFIDLVKVSLQ